MLIAGSFGAVDAIVVLVILVLGVLALCVVVWVGEMIVAAIGHGDVKKGNARIGGWIASGVLLLLALLLFGVPTILGIFMIWTGFSSDNGWLILGGLGVVAFVAGIFISILYNGLPF